mmetsp:Transcript_12366/g.17570  ORF Transcript_12366/g.17570 Transcript_12366/m.17570 type:complete len:281 (+) Transcript_12366:502-1344(+)
MATATSGNARSGMTFVTASANAPDSPMPADVSFTILTSANSFSSILLAILSMSTSASGRASTTASTRSSFFFFTSSLSSLSAELVEPSSEAVATTAFAFSMVSYWISNSDEASTIATANSRFSGMASTIFRTKASDTSSTTAVFPGLLLLLPSLLLPLLRSFGSASTTASAIDLDTSRVCAFLDFVNKAGGLLISGIIGSMAALVNSTASCGSTLSGTESAIFSARADARTDTNANRGSVGRSDLGGGRGLEARSSKDIFKSCLTNLNMSGLDISLPCPS